MRELDYVRATDAASAVAAVSANPAAVFLGGGTNLVDHLKLGIRSPELLVDVSRLPMDEVAAYDGPGGSGLRVGAIFDTSLRVGQSFARRRESRESTESVA